MNYEEFQKLELRPGAKVLVRWFDAAEVYKDFRSELTDDDAITLLETVGDYIELHVSPFFPEAPHLIIYEGQRKVYNPKSKQYEMKHVYSSIPLSLVHTVEVLKRAKKTTKKHPTLYVLMMENCEKHFLRGKVV